MTRADQDSRYASAVDRNRRTRLISKRLYSAGLPLFPLVETLICQPSHCPVERISRSDNTGLAYLCCPSTCKGLVLHPYRDD